MPATNSAKKRLKTDKKKQIRNLKTKRTLKALTKKFNQIVSLKKQEESGKTLPKMYSALDRAVSKGVMHKNTARRRKSRLTKKVNKLKNSSLS